LKKDLEALKSRHGKGVGLNLFAAEEPVDLRPQPGNIARGLSQHPEHLAFVGAAKQLIEVRGTGVI